MSKGIRNKKLRKACKWNRAENRGYHKLDNGMIVSDPYHRMYKTMKKGVVLV